MSYRRVAELLDAEAADLLVKHGVIQADDIEPTHWVVTCTFVTKNRDVPHSLASAFRYLSYGYANKTVASQTYLKKQTAHTQASMARKAGLLAEITPCVLTQVGDKF